MSGLATMVVKPLFFILRKQTLTIKKQNTTFGFKILPL
jgi:hypothetical protein